MTRVITPEALYMKKKRKAQSPRNETFKDETKKNYTKKFKIKISIKRMMVKIQIKNKFEGNKNF
jgi:hypothetical protein